jgi:hypothetical protein
MIYLIIPCRNGGAAVLACCVDTYDLKNDLIIPCRNGGAAVLACCVDTYENDIFDYSLQKWRGGCVGMLC